MIVQYSVISVVSVLVENECGFLYGYTLHWYFFQVRKQDVLCNRGKTPSSVFFFFLPLQVVVSGPNVQLLHLAQFIS